MRNLIRALSKLPSGRLQMLIRAGRVDAKVRSLEDRLAAVRRSESRLERKLEIASRQLASLLGDSGPARRGPGRPPKHRGPGRPPLKRGPGRPRKSESPRGGPRPKNERPLAEVLRAVLASNKGQSMTVGELGAAAREAGFKTKSNPAVFAITTSLVLRKRTDWFARDGRKYRLAKAAEGAAEA